MDIDAKMTFQFSETIVQSNTILYCDNYEQTVRFYRDVLHLQVCHKRDWFVEFKLFDQAFLSIADTKQTTIESSKGNGITISLKVEYIDQVHAWFYEQGIIVSEIKSVWGSKAFYLSDPEGHRIELWA